MKLKEETLKSSNNENEENKSHEHAEFKEKSEKQNSEKPKEETKDKPEEKSEGKTETEKISYSQKIKESYPRVGKVIDFSVGAWKQTFPTQRSMSDIKKRKKNAPKPADQDLPDWKKGAIIEGKAENNVKSKLKSTLEQSKTYQNILKSEQYKKYEEFSKTTQEFREDLKEHLTNHPSAFVQTSLGLMSKVSAGSTSSRAIEEMRKLKPGFDIWDLEEDARGIFEHAYTLFLNSDLKELELICSETALAYFKALIKKREVEKSEPKIKNIWHLDRAFFSGAQIKEQGVPVFTFTIKSQEIYCMVSLKDNTKIVDGDEDRILQYEYGFTLKPILDYDEVESLYDWEIIECQPRQVTMMLA